MPKSPLVLLLPGPVKGVRMYCFQNSLTSSRVASGVEPVEPKFKDAKEESDVADEAWEPEVPLDSAVRSLASELASD